MSSRMIVIDRMEDIGALHTLLYIGRASFDIVADFQQNPEAAPLYILIFLGLFRHERLDHSVVLRYSPLHQELPKITESSYAVQTGIQFLLERLSSFLCSWRTYPQAF